MNELISVIVPIYNVEQYLEKCIESIEKQTYDNLEIILVDDGSPDNCGEICDEYAAKDSRIRAIHKKNGGLSDARNAGIDEAKGKYILFVDSDDYINANMISALYSSILENSADLAMCQYKDVDEEQVIDYQIKEDYSDAFVLTEEEFFSNKIYNQDRKTEFIVAWNKLYARKLFEDVRYPKGKIHEDEFTTYKLLYKASKIVYVPHTLYYYVQRKNSIMSAGIEKKRLMVLDAISERLNFYDGNKAVNYWKYDFFNYMRSYVRYLGAIKDSKELTIEDFKKYNQIFRMNMKKYYALKSRNYSQDIKVWFVGYFPYLYAKVINIVHKYE